MKTLGAVVLITLMSASCGDDGTANNSSDVPTSTTTTIMPTSSTTSASTTTEAPTTSTDPGVRAPDWPFNGLVAGAWNSPAVDFYLIGGRTAVSSVNLEEGQLGCGLDLTATGDGVYLGTHVDGWPEAEFVPWGGQPSGVVENPSDGATLESTIGEWVASVDDTQIPNRLTFHHSGQLLFDVAVAGQEGRFVQIHGFDGAHILLRAEADEPVCERGILVLVDLESGRTSCAKGTGLTAELVGEVAPKPEIAPLSDPLISDFSACLVNGIVDLIDAD
ncbi:MAG: hypothetical protein GY720_07145 [bacterium]|nr:hypothetical protein [bacterium]